MLYYYFSLERKVIKSSRLHRLGYSGKRLRSTSGTRYAQTAAALTASSSAFALRPPAEVDEKKAPLSLRIADTASVVVDGVGNPQRVALRLLFRPQLASVKRRDRSERPEQMLFERSEFICDSERRERSSEAGAALTF